ASTTTVLKVLLVSFSPPLGTTAQAASRTEKIKRQVRPISRDMATLVAQSDFSAKCCGKLHRRSSRGACLCKNRLFFVPPELKAFTSIMRIRFVFLPAVLAFGVLLWNSALAAKAPLSTPSPTATVAPKPVKPVVDQTAQTIIFCYHGLV